MPHAPARPPPANLTSRTHRTFGVPAHVHLSRQTWIVSAAVIGIAVLIQRIPRSLLRLLKILSVPVWIALVVAGLLFGNVLVCFLWDWFDGSHAQAQRAIRRRERRRRAVRSLRSHFVDSSAPPAEVDAEFEPDLDSLLSSRGIPSKISAQLHATLNLLVNTFIIPWYTRISPSPQFPTQVQSLILDVLISLSSRVAEMDDLPQVLVRRIVPRLTKHLAEYRRIEHLLGETAGSLSALPQPGKTGTINGGGHFETSLGVLDPAAILQSQFPSLHRALPPSSLSNPTPTIHAHLRMLSDRLLPLLLAPPASSSGTNTTTTDPLLTTFIRELLVGKILGSLLDTLSDPDTLNKLVEDQADKYRVRREEVSQLRAALENASSGGAGEKDGAGGTKEGRVPRTPRGKDDTRVFEGGGTIKKHSFATTEQDSPTRRIGSEPNLSSSISEWTSPKEFDAFLRSISKLKRVNEAKRMRGDVDRAIRRTEKELGDLSSGVERVRLSVAEAAEREKGRRVKVAHLERLEVARRRVDRKVRELLGDVHEDSHAQAPALVDPDAIPLRTILQDPAANSFFMEFMDRRKRSRLVQFWIAVEVFKSPLEVIGSEEDEEDENELTLGGHASQLWDASAIGTAEEDLRRIWEGYLDEEIVSEDAISVEPRFMDGIRKAARQPEDATLQQRRRALLSARASSVRAQRQIYDRMEEDDYPDFRRTELFRHSAATISADLQRLTSRDGATGQNPSPKVLYPISESASATSRSGPSLFVRPGAPSIQVPKWLSFSGKNNTKIKSDPTSPVPAGKSSTTSSPHLLTPTEIEARELQATKELEIKRSAMRRLRSWSVSRSPSSLPMSPGEPKAASTEFLFGSPDESSSTNRQSTRGALFDDDFVDKTSRIIPEPEIAQRFVGEDTEDDDFVQIERMEAIQAALTSIIAKDDVKPDWLFARPRQFSAQQHDTGSRASASSQAGDDNGEEVWAEAMSGSAISDPGSRTTMTPFSRPSMTVPTLSTDLVTAIGRSHHSAAGLDDSAELPKVRYDMGDVQLAKPGELELTVEIARMGDRIDKLRDQEATLETMIRTAELTGKQSELILLQRSQKDLQREVRTLGFRRAQYERQEFDNRLVYSQTRITIPSTMDESTPDGRVIRYVIEVQQFSADGDYRHGWTVARRYNDFYELNQELRATSGIGDELRTRSIEMPGKQLVPIYTPAFLEHRRIALERYLKLLIGLRSGCDSPAVRAFLSRQSLALGSRRTSGGSKPHPRRMPSSTTGNGQGNAVKSLYKTVAASLDDIMLGPSMLDIMTDKMSKQTAGASEAWDTSLVQLGNYSLDVGSAYLGSAFSPFVVGSADPDRQQMPRPGPNATHSTGPPSTFTGPICDLMVELIGFKETNWMRKQALILVVQQLLGSTIERKFRDGVKQAMHENAAVQYLTGFRDLIWPGGKPRLPSPERTDGEKLRTKVNAARKLQAAVPDIVASMIGKGNANRATRRIFSVYQVKLLNQHLILTLLDEILLAIFPEIGPLEGKAHGHYA